MEEIIAVMPAAGDEWETAEASRGKAIAASGIADLRERVGTAAELLTDVGNIRQLANVRLYEQTQDPVEARLDETFFEPAAHSAEPTHGKPLRARGAS